MKNEQARGVNSHDIAKEVEIHQPPALNCFEKVG